MNESEALAAAELLKKLEPGYLPRPIFEQVTRLATMSIIEIVPLRAHNGKIEVLLQKRPDDDPVWPGQLHTAGTVIRATDLTYEDAIKRVLTSELALQAGTPTFVTHILHHSGRGRENAMVYWLEITDVAGGGTFYNADELPQNFVQSQLDFLPTVIAHFKQSKQL